MHEFWPREMRPRHWRHGWLRLLWHYRLWLALSGCLWLAGGFIIYAAARWL